MQQGANSATPPAKKAARTEPVVSRSPNGLTPECLRESTLELAPRKPSGAEVLPVQQNEWTHRRPMLFHQFPTGLVADRQHADGHRKGLRQDRKRGLGVLAQVTRWCLDQRDHNRYADRLGLWAVRAPFLTLTPHQGHRLNSTHTNHGPLDRQGS